MRITAVAAVALFASAIAHFRGPAEVPPGCRSLLFGNGPAAWGIQSTGTTAVAAGGPVVVVHADTNYGAPTHNFNAYLICQMHFANQTHSAVSVKYYLRASETGTDTGVPSSGAEALFLMDEQPIGDSPSKWPKPCFTVRAVWDAAGRNTPVVASGPTGTPCALDPRDRLWVVAVVQHPNAGQSIVGNFRVVVQGGTDQQTIP